MPGTSESVPDAVAGGSEKAGLSSTLVASHRHADPGEQDQGPVKCARYYRRSQSAVEAGFHDGLRQMDMDHGNHVIAA
jgi:hypothetical protein